MTPFQLVRSCILGLALGSATASALAAAAVAHGDGNYTHTLTEAADVAQAKQAALEKCEQVSANCKILVWGAEAGAIAIVKGDDGTSAQISDTPVQAHQSAMLNCRKYYKNCRFTALYWEPGVKWAALVASRDERGANTMYFFNHDYLSEADATKATLAACQASKPGATDQCAAIKAFHGTWFYALASSSSRTGVAVGKTRAEAEADALDGCRNKGGEARDACKITGSAVNQGPQRAPASFAAVAALTEQARGARKQVRVATAPAARSLSCTNRCVNGSCVRTFADGRTQRWQAQQTFDPFTNTWKWDTSSCGA